MAARIGRPANAVAAKSAGSMRISHSSRRQIKDGGGRCKGLGEVALDQQFGKVSGALDAKRLTLLFGQTANLRLGSLAGRETASGIMRLQPRPR
jgi:hypothetical protein